MLVKSVKRISIALLFVLCISHISAFSGVYADSSEPVRIEGSNRYGTSENVINQMVKEKQRFDSMIIASGANFPDALSGGFLSNSNRPILLCNPNAQSVPLYFIRHNLSKNNRETGKKSKVYILGGESAVPKSFANTLKEYGYDVVRLSGKSRYDTNLAILDECFTKGDDLLVASGKNYADSLSASAVNKGLMIVDDNLKDSQMKWLQNNTPKKIYILGGKNAVNTSVENQLRKYAKVERIGGGTRYETSALIAKKFFPRANYLVAATGNNFPDGLSGAPLAKHHNAPILLVAEGFKGEDPARNFANQQMIGFDSIYVLGGKNAVPNRTVHAMFKRTVTLDIACFYNDGASTAGTIKAFEGKGMSYVIHNFLKRQGLDKVKTTIKVYDYPIEGKRDRNNTKFQELISNRDMPGEQYIAKSEITPPDIDPVSYNKINDILIMPDTATYIKVIVDSDFK